MLLRLKLKDGTEVSGRYSLDEILGRLKYAQDHAQVVEISISDIIPDPVADIVAEQQMERAKESRWI